MLPLEGIRVLDLTTLSGYCGMELADYGAEVIKVEAPGTGDPLRELAPLKDGASPHHTFRDRGKKSITLDLEKPEGKEIFKKLVATADAVIENFPPGTMEDLGLGYEELSAIKPSLVYGRTSAYGSVGKRNQYTTERFNCSGEERCNAFYRISRKSAYKNWIFYV